MKIGTVLDTRYSILGWLKAARRNLTRAYPRFYTRNPSKPGDNLLRLHHDPHHRAPNARRRAPARPGFFSSGVLQA
jgi:hypothetical protein